MGKTTTSNFSQETSTLFQLQPDIQLQGNENLGYLDKKKNHLVVDWLAHTWSVGQYHPMREHYKPSGTSVLIHEVNLGPEATVSCPN